MGSNKFSKISIIIFAVFLLSTFYFLLSPGDVFAEPSQTNLTYPWSKAKDPGTLVQQFYMIALGLAGGAALGVMIYGAILYTVSAGNTSKQQEARSYITSAIWGVALLLGAYLILYTINPDLVKIGETQKWLDSLIKPVEVSKEETKLITPLTSSTAALQPTYSVGEQLARQELTQVGIGFKDPCSIVKTTDCVKLDGVRQTTLGEVIGLKSACSGCNIYVTGGTEEVGGHAVGQYSHVNGYKVDLRLNDELTSYIEKNFRPYGTRSDGAPMYVNPKTGARYALERNHWDILVP